MLLTEHLKAGQRVRCMYPGSRRTGQTGTIEGIDGRGIAIKWDDGYSLDLVWGAASSFDPIEDEKPTPTPVPVAKAPTPIGTPIPLDVCKRHYYGIQEPCTCKSRK